MNHADADQMRAIIIIIAMMVLIFAVITDRNPVKCDEGETLITFNSDTFNYDNGDQVCIDIDTLDP